MGEIKQTNRNRDVIKTASAIVERHRGEFPDFITDYRVVLGYSDEEPALFILLKAVGEDEAWPSQDWTARADAYRRLEDTIVPELIDAVEERFPTTFLVPDWRWETFPD